MTEWFAENTIANIPKQNVTTTNAQRYGPEREMNFPAIVPGQRAEAARPNANAGESGISLKSIQSVTGIVRFNRNWPSSDSGML